MANKQKRQYPSWCYVDSYGNRPCDNGMLCDWCMYQHSKQEEEKNSENEENKQNKSTK